MELWLDTTDLDLIKDAANLSILTGVTTNPSILSKTDKPPEMTLKILLASQPGYVAAQVIATDLEGMLSQARKLALLDKRMIIKIPANADGFRAMALLKQENITTMATAIFEPLQVLFSALNGAAYAAPYLGRIAKNSDSENALNLLRKMQNIIRVQEYPTKILAAAIYTTEQFVNCAEAGISAITLPGKIYKQIFSSNKVVEGNLRKFEEDWCSNSYTKKSTLFS